MTAPRIPRGMVPLVSGHRRGAPGGVDRTEVEGGPARYALAYDRGLQTYDVSMKLTALQMSIWNIFFTRIVLKGAVSFTMQLDSGGGMADHLVNIVPGSYSDAPLQGRRFWIVSFQVEAENKAYDLTDADAEALIAVYEGYGPATDALLRRLARFATVDTFVLAP